MSDLEKNRLINMVKDMTEEDRYFLLSQFENKLIFKLLEERDQDKDNKLNTICNCFYD